MRNTDIPDLDQYWGAIVDAVPGFSHEEQRAALAVYRELAKGEPVSAEQLAQALGVTTRKALELLERDPLKAFIYSDDWGGIIGFGGLAASPMHHKFGVEGRTLWTWCAWDSLFIPEILGKTARVQSPDPETGETVRLVVSPERIESVEPETAVISFLLPNSADFSESAANIMATFCHFVFFFASYESGRKWAAKHEGTFLYSLEEAFELARRLNRKIFGDELT
jgi:alkylmercury lyase